MAIQRTGFKHKPGVEDTDTTEAFNVSGRGEPPSVLLKICAVRATNLVVSNPVVIYKTIDGVKCEPVEHLTIDAGGIYRNGLWTA